MFVTVPPNSQATVFVPTPQPSSLSEGGKPIAKAKGVTEVKAGNGYVKLKVSAGSYEFSCLHK